MDSIQAEYQGADLGRARSGLSFKDGEVLLRALEIREGDHCVAIAGGGEGPLAMLSRRPGRVMAIDNNAAQTGILAVKVAAFRCLEHSELLEFVGVRPCSGERRLELYSRLRLAIPSKARLFWDANRAVIAAGVNHCGKIERYFDRVRRWLLPFVYSKETIDALLTPRDGDQRAKFFDDVVCGKGLQRFLRICFSRAALSRLSGEPLHKEELKSGMDQVVMERLRRGLVEMDPCANPFVSWVLRGELGDALPFAYRPENFAAIRENLDRIEIHCSAVDGFLERRGASWADRFDMGLAFESMPEPAFYRLLERLVHASRSGARMVHWNLFLSRVPPDWIPEMVPLSDIAAELWKQDSGFLYAGVFVHEVRKEGYKGYVDRSTRLVRSRNAA